MQLTAQARQQETMRGQLHRLLLEGSRALGLALVQGHQLLLAAHRQLSLLLLAARVDLADGHRDLLVGAGVDHRGLLLRELAQVRLLGLNLLRDLAQLRRLHLLDAARVHRRRAVAELRARRQALGRQRLLLELRRRLELALVESERLLRRALRQLRLLLLAARVHLERDLLDLLIRLRIDERQLLLLHRADARLERVRVLRHLAELRRLELLDARRVDRLRREARTVAHRRREARAVARAEARAVAVRRPDLRVALNLRVARHTAERRHGARNRGPDDAHCDRGVETRAL